QASSPALVFNWRIFSRGSRCSCFGSLAESPRFAARFVMASSAPRCRAPGVNTIFYRRSIIPRSDSWRDLFPLPLASPRPLHSPRWRLGNTLSEYLGVARRGFYPVSLFGGLQAFVSVTSGLAAHAYIVLLS